MCSCLLNLYVISALFQMNVLIVKMILMCAPARVVIQPVNVAKSANILYPMKIVHPMEAHAPDVMYT